MFDGFHLKSCYLGRGLNYNATNEKQIPFYNSGIAKPKLSENTSSIPPFWFYNETLGDEVVLPSSVKAVHDYAFKKARMNKLKCPKGLTKVGVGAFESCTVEDFEQEGTGLVSIGKNAFSNCSLKKIILADGIETIEDYAFYGCSNLDLHLPPSVKHIGSYAFYGCSRMVSLQLPFDLKTLGDRALTESGIFSVTIPKSITKLDEFAFYGCDNLSEINGLEHIVSIGRYALNGTAITSISLPTSITTLPDAIFENCKKLETVYLNNNITGIPSRAFAGCISLKQFDIPSSITKIYSEAFKGCNSLECIILPDNLEHISFGAFSNCTSLEEIEFPDKIEQLGSDVLSECKNLKKVKLPRNAITLDNTFTNCQSLETVTIPDGIKFLDNPFVGCSSLRKIIIEDSTQPLKVELRDKKTGQWIKGNTFADTPLDTLYVGRNLVVYSLLADRVSLPIKDSEVDITNSFFYGVESLDLLILGGKMNTVPTYCFNDSRVGTVKIMNSVKTIEKKAFIRMQCDSIIVENETPIELAQNSITECDIYVPDGCGDVYRSNSTWGMNCIIDPKDEIKHVKVRFPGTIIASMRQQGIKDPSMLCKLSVEGEVNKRDWEELKSSMPHLYYLDLKHMYSDTIPDNQFANNFKIKDIILPDSIIYIGNSAFEGCKNLKVDTLRFNECKSVGEKAFYESPVTNVVFTRSVNIGKSAFEKSQINSFTCNDSVTFQNNAFATCKQLNTLILNCKDARIGENAFIECENLETIQLPMFSVSIGSNAFRNCKSLHSLTLPQHSTIGDYAFANTSIKTLNFGEDISRIGKYAFMNCGQLEGCVTLPSSVTEVSEGLFKNCDKLESIILSEKLKTINNEAFSGCSSLSNIALPSSLRTIGLNSFNGCASLNELDLPGSLTNIDGALRYCNLKKLTVHWKIPLPVSSNTFEGINEDECVLHVPNNSLYYYMTTDVWNKFWQIEEYISENIPLVEFIDSEVKELCISNWDLDGDKEINEEEAYRIDDIGTVFAKNSKIKSLDDLKYFKRVNTIKENAFRDCLSLKTVTIPENIKLIEQGAFEGCIELNYVHLPKSLDKISASLFKGCVSLSKVDMPDNIKELGNNCFDGCTSLKALHLPDSLEIIRRYALPPNLDILRIPASVTTIDVKQYRPKNMYVQWEEPLPIESSTFSISYNNNKTALYVPKGASAKYKADDGWGKFDKIYEPMIVGDINDDLLINIADITSIVSVLHNKNISDFRLDAADINNDGYVLIDDLTDLISMILDDKEDPQYIKALRSNESNKNSNGDSLIIGWDGNDLQVAIPGTLGQICGIQFDVTMPENINITNVLAYDENHRYSVSWKLRDDGNTRILLYSMNGEYIDQDVSLLQLELIGADNTSYSNVISLCNVIYVDDKHVAGHIPDSFIDISNGATGISEFIGTDKEECVVYNIKGEIVTIFDKKKHIGDLPKGIYIIENKKYIVR